MFKECKSTEKIGDGKIFVLDMEQAIRIRTGEKDDEALGASTALLST